MKRAVLATVAVLLLGAAAWTAMAFLRTGATR